MSVLRLDIALEHLEAAAGELQIPDDYPMNNGTRFLIRRALETAEDACRNLRLAMQDMERYANARKR